MKKILATTLLLAIFTSSAFAEVTKYNLDPNHTNVTWHANHFGFSNPSGKFNEVSGFANLDLKNPKTSAVEVTIKTDSINTGITKFDAHLKSADFLNVEKFPTAKFVSKKVIVTGKNTAKVEGELTLAGVTKPLTLNVTLNKSGTHPFTQKPTVGFSAKATIVRSEYGINYGIPGVSDKVALDIETEASVE